MFSFIISCNLMEVNWLPASTSLSKLQCVAFDWNREQIMLKFPLFYFSTFFTFAQLIFCNVFSFTVVIIFILLYLFWNFIIFYAFERYGLQGLHPAVSFLLMSFKPTLPRTSLCFFVPQTHTHTHKVHHHPTLACLPTQQASSMGSQSPGLSQGVGLRVRQPLPCLDCYYRGSSVNVVSI